MAYIIILTQNFRHRRGMYTPGRYRVPLDMPEAFAEQAVARGWAFVDEPPPAAAAPAPGTPPANPSARAGARRPAKPPARPPAKPPAEPRRGAKRADHPAALETIAPRWDGEACVVVAAPGPSLTPQLAEACRGRPAIAVNDAWRLLPWADMLYACDAKWWDIHHGCPGFAGEKWSSHSASALEADNDKRAAADKWGLRLVEGRGGDGFSQDPALIHYGSNSGFQAVNLALLMGAKRVVMIGFDMRPGHFFGDHPPPLRNTPDYGAFIAAFTAAAKLLPSGVEIVNATPGSALTCFPLVELADALAA